MPRTRLPGLEVPKKLERELRFFLDSVKERLEVLSGERSNPLERAATVGDLKSTGVVKVAVKNGYAELTGAGTEAGASSETSEEQSIENALSLFTIEADEIGDDHVVVLYDMATGSYRRIAWEEFITLFVTEESGYPPQLRHAGI